MRTGNLIEGHLYDVDRSAFEAALKAYDSELFLQWNPAKRRGLGCWEVWRKPVRKTEEFQAEYEGSPLYTVEEPLSDFTDHVKDLPFLNFHFFKRLKEMDVWRNYGHKGRDFGRDLESREEQEQNAILAKNQADLKYKLRHDRKLFRKLREMALSGVNLNQIAAHWGSSKP